MALVKSSEVGLRIAQALGLGGMKIRGITISIPADNLVSATVEIYPDSAQFGAIGTLIKEYDSLERKAVETEQT